MKFVPVDPNSIENVRDTHRGRVSYPILKGFLETNHPLAMLDRTGMQQSMMTLNSCLNSYIRNHDLPIKIFTRRGQMYLMRLDIDAEGNPIKDWRAQTQEAQAGSLDDDDVMEIDDEEVEKRFAEEIGKATK